MGALDLRGESPLAAEMLACSVGKCLFFAYTCKPPAIVSCPCPSDVPTTPTNKKPELPKELDPELGWRLFCSLSHRLCVGTPGPVTASPRLFTWRKGRVSHGIPGGLPSQTCPSGRGARAPAGWQSGEAEMGSPQAGLWGRSSSGRRAPQTAAWGGRGVW